MKTITMATLVAGLLLSACGGSDDDDNGGARYATLSGERPQVIGHRGASGERPEHTLASYQLAIDQGADFIEPDVVMTSDGHLIARHEPMLDGTTDVATKFPASRMRTRLLDGVPTTAYFANDFSLAEIRTLRAVQASPTRAQQYNGQFPIPTVDEVIALAKTAGDRRGRVVGVIPEIKHSTFMAGLFGANAVEDALVAKLHAAYGNRADAPVVIQSFEVANLQYLNTKTNLRLVQLVDGYDVDDDGSMQLVAPYRQPYDFVVAGDPRTNADLLTDTGLAFVKTYADAIAPWKPYLVRTVNDNRDRNNDGVINLNDRRVDGSTGVIERAHRAGLMVYTWTFRNDASGYGFADPVAEMRYYANLGIDGVFTDFPASGRQAVDGMR